MLLPQDDVDCEHATAARGPHQKRGIPREQHGDGAGKASPQRDVVLDGIEERQRGEPQREGQRKGERARGGLCGADLKVRLYDSLDR